MLGVAACDVGSQHNETSVGPLVHIVGTSLGGPQGGVVPTNGSIQIAFDRYLLPATISRQSFTILDNTNRAIDVLGQISIYDPVARTVKLTGPNGDGQPWLTEGQFYKLVFNLPKDSATDAMGFRAIDRAPLDPNQPLEYVFQASGTTAAVLEPTVDFCADVMPIFLSKCGGSSCHGGVTGVAPETAASLVLTTATGVKITALSRVAQAANTSGRTGLAESANRVFGVNMALIKAGDPSSSWLMYKVEMARESTLDGGANTKPYTVACTPSDRQLPERVRPYVPLAPALLSPADNERYILSNYILGREMPFPATPDAYNAPGAYGVTPLTFDERERIRLWIAQDAKVLECGSCTVTP